MSSAINRRSPSFKRRLAKARKALGTAELKILRGKLDELEAQLASKVSPAKLTGADGTVEAVVLFGQWMRDQAAGEEGPAIGYRVGSGMPAVTLLMSHADDEMLPDIAVGDRVQIRRTGRQRHTLVRVTHRARKRERIDFLSSWRAANAPGISALAYVMEAA